MSKGKDVCRWCRGTGRAVVLGAYGFPAETEPCPHCAALDALDALAQAHPGLLSPEEARALVEGAAWELDEGEA
jgi:hypothetical protein